MVQILLVWPPLEVLQGYAGSNNNMGMEVDWRDIKEQVPHTASLGTFI